MDNDRPDDASGAIKGDAIPRFTGSADSSSIMAGIQGLRKTGILSQVLEI
jgi:hypothetical protein